MGAFYYNKYFKKAFNLKMFGVNELSGLVDYIKDTIAINAKSNMLEAPRSEDCSLSEFVKATEEHRRERQRRMDAGDETAQLKFTKPSPPPQKQQQTGRPQAPRYPPASRPGVQSGSTTYSATARYGAQSSSSYSAQKRPYTPPPGAYPPAKAPRTYGGGYSGGGGYRR